MRKVLSIRVLFFGVALCMCSQAFAAPRAKLWDFWYLSDERSIRTLSHVSWDEFLAKYLSIGDDGIARISYGEVAPIDRVRLDVYVNVLSKMAVLSLTRDEQLAFWINLYNALTVKIILDNYPVSSIKKISRGLPLGPWNDPIINIERESLTLNDIEHRILRPIWRDPRLHYVISCASIGCPNIPPRALTAANTEKMLNEAARAFINHPRAVSILRNGVRVSSIYAWYEGDFGGSDAAVISHLKRYADPALRARLERQQYIVSHHYDWSLNDN